MEIAEAPQLSWSISEELSTDKYWMSKLMVLHTPAGYYIGRMCMDRDKSDPDYLPFEQPYSRESSYFCTEEEATIALVNGFDRRDCVENNFAYSEGRLSFTAK